ncbi:MULTISPECIES: type IV pilin-like G/H family protein [unclassified Microcoleus]|uniref:type IV pilin-like G/H family protein n=1 Tax=unclassified Microcoleus TaxID=2642155 RepID=UPI002FD00669
MSQQHSKSASLASNVGGCLVLLIMIGVFVLLVRPSFLKKVRNIKQAEARDYVRSINKGQQAYLAEKSVFSTSVKALGIGIKTETENYKYSLVTTKKATFNYGSSKQKDLKSYVGGVFVIPAKEVEPNAAQEEITTTSILCQADFSGTIKPAEPIYQNGKIACGKDTTQVTR